MLAAAPTRSAAAAWIALALAKGRTNAFQAMHAVPQARHPERVAKRLATQRAPLARALLARGREATEQIPG